MISNYTASVGGNLINSRYGTNGGKCFASPLKDLNEQTVLVENAEKNYNDSYRQHTKYDDKRDSYYSTYDLGILLQNKESYLEGKLDRKSDVDYYSFSYGQRAFYEKVGISSEITISMETSSEVCDYELTVYDADGNQIGIAKENGNGKKQLTIPDWNGQSSQYTIRIENKNGEEVEENGAYRISISEQKEAVKSSSDELEYEEHLERLHREQWNDLPEDEKYRGGLSKDELLEKLAAGETLTSQEFTYLKIFAGLSEYEQAESQGNIKTSLLPELIDEVQKAGVEVKGKEWGIEVDAGGNISVTGDFTEEERQTILQVIGQGYGDRLWHSYMNASDVTAETYGYIEGYRNLSQFLDKALNGQYSWQDVKVDDNGKISGLPSKMCELLNSQECNGRYEELRDTIYMLNDYGKTHDVDQELNRKAQYQIAS